MPELIQKRIKKGIQVCKRFFVVPVIFITLMMTMIIFSQMSMEICTYGFIVNENMKNDFVYKEESVHEKNTKQISNRKNKEKHIAGNDGQNESRDKQVSSQNETDNCTSFELIKPIEGGVTTSVFGDIVSRTAKHLGHDWAVNVGTKIVAAQSGTIEKAYLSESYGYNILINHNNGFQTRYAHMSKLYVTVGDVVKQGDVIGLSGNTGDSTGPHLHFEVIQNNRRINPLIYLK